MKLDPNTTFLLDGQEVKLTGRYAVRTIKNKEQLLYEVQAMDLEEGSFKKWVRPEELYTIIEGM